MRTFIVLILSLMLVAFVACSKKADQQADSATQGSSLALDSAQADTSARVAQTEQPQTEPAPVENQVATQKKEEPKLKATEAAKPKKPTYLTIPEGTALAITLVDSIDTDVDSTGNEFKGQLAEPIVVNGKTLFEAGAPVTGVLTKVVESGHLKTPAELEFSLSAIQDPTGQWIGIVSDTIAEKKASHTGKDVGLIGGGTVVGGIIGKLTKKKGGTLIGAAAGAAAGTAAAAATGKQDIVHHAGETVTFQLKTPADVAVK